MLLPVGLALRVSAGAKVGGVYPARGRQSSLIAMFVLCFFQGNKGACFGAVLASRRPSLRAPPIIVPDLFMVILYIGIEVILLMVVILVYCLPMS